METFLLNDNSNEFFKSLSVIFEVTMDMLKEQIEKMGIDIECLDSAEFVDEYEKKELLVGNSDGILLAKQYGKQVGHWLDSLKERDSVGMEIRLQDEMQSDCLEVIQWYQYLLEIKFARALMSQKNEEEEGLEAYDSLGIAKLLLVSITRNIGAWGYFYQKFKEDEDEIFDILICLQRLERAVEQTFPEARSFIRPGLD
jgi:hypothetical protein